VIPLRVSDADKARLDLRNRPSLTFSPERVDELANALALDPAKRQQFLAAPAPYLAAEGLPVDSCELVVGSPAQTSEACTLYAFCAYYVNLLTVTKAANFVAIVNAFTVSNYSYVSNYKNTSNFGYQIDRQPEIDSFGLGSRDGLL
jgi:transglutaminase-like putative cysteine protease